MPRRMVIEKAERLHQAPPYPVEEMDKYKKKLIARGINPVDLTVGLLEAPGREDVLDRLTAAVRVPRPTLPFTESSIAFREAFAAWFAQRFDVDLDPATQILPLLNTKIGVSCLSLALLNPGDSALVPDPAYPAYRTGVIMAGAQTHTLPLLERNDYLPNLRQIDTTVAQRARLMFLSYPNNPTGAVADLGFFREVTAFARTHNIIVCHDASHYFVTYNGYEPPSFLQASGSLDVGVEFFSLSVLFGGHPWDIAVAVGNPAILSAMAQLTRHFDSPLFHALSDAGVVALQGADVQIAETVEAYTRRRDILIDGLHEVGWKIRKPQGSIYAWLTVPPKYSSVRFSVLLRKAGVFAVPGSYMGEFGEGYLRLTLQASETDLQTVTQRIEQCGSRLRFRRLKPTQLSLV